MVIIFLALGAELFRIQCHVFQRVSTHNDIVLAEGSGRFRFARGLVGSSAAGLAKVVLPDEGAKVYAMLLWTWEVAVGQWCGHTVRTGSGVWDHVIAGITACLTD